MANVDEALRQIRSTYPEPRKTDGKVNVRLTFREQAFADVIQVLIDHVAQRDGNEEISKFMCKGCAHDRMEVCPTAVARTLLAEVKPQ